MAQTFASRQLRHRRAMDTRFTQEHRDLAQNIGRIVTRYSRLPDLVVPDTRAMRQNIRTAVWDTVLRPYYLGAGDDPFLDGRPQSPYAQMLYDGIEGATRISVQQQIATTRRVVKDSTVWRWLTGDRPFILEIGAYDPFHTWVDPNGYTLSDRVWRNTAEIRTRIDRLLDYHISQGTSAVKIAELLEDFMTPGASKLRTLTPYGRTPYGTEGSYAARRLARTEISAAAGRATINSSIANPFVAGIQWRLSASHDKPDICDDNARGGPNGDGVYPPEQLPPYPAHPHDLCALLPVTIGSPSDLVDELRAGIANGRRSDLQGILNENWLVNAILSGAIGQLISRIRGIFA